MIKRVPAFAALALAATLAVAGCASSSSGSSSGPGTSALSGASQAAMQNPNLDLGSSLDGKKAPDIKLVNQFGQPMSLSQFRGRVVILAFSDSECTTVCPLTTQSMVLAKELLGKAGEQVQLLGVDANPTATKVSDVMAYSRAHGMVNQWDFLTGSDAQLKSVWKAYNIQVAIESGQIDHTPALYVIDADGTLEKLYLTAMAVLKRDPVRAGARDRGGQPAAQPPEAGEYRIARHHRAAGPGGHRDPAPGGHVRREGQGPAHSDPGTGQGRGWWSSSPPGSPRPPTCRPS